MRGKQFAEARLKWSLAVILCVLLSAALAVPAQGAPRPNRIHGVLGSGAPVQVAGSVHPLVRRSTDLGPVDPSMKLPALTLNFGLSAAQQAELEALLAAQHDPASPQYHQWLTQEEYGARFGLTDADLEQVRSWLESQGFTVTGVSRSRNAMYFSGSAWQVESAFHTQLHRYERHGKKHFANASDLQLPAQLAAVVVSVGGLNSYRPRPHSVARPQPTYTVNTTQGLMHFLSPADWATIYNVNAIYSAGYTGAGAFVGVVGQTYAPQLDIDNFRSAAGLGATKLDYVCISKTGDCNGTASGDLFEADLDIEWAGGIAKDATVTYVYAAADVPSQNVFDALQYAVETYTVPATGTVLPVISMSYGSCELFYSTYGAYLDGIGQQAASQGQTLVVASGDTGADCHLDTNYPATMGEYVTIPADSPYFLGVGGTTLSGDESSPATYWDQTPDKISSALQYIPEEVWNDTVENNQLSASGGGISQYFAQPNGSSGTGGFTQPTPSNYSGTPGRFVPDISFAASANHDGYVICSQDLISTPGEVDCTSDFFSNRGYLYLAGGTSAGAPTFAGMLTLLGQAFGPQGNFNVVLYGLAADSATYASVFHDVTTGDNIVACSGGSGCDSVTQTMGYSATTGYDLTTGLGSIDGGQLYAAMGTPLPATTTTVSASPNPVVLNQQTTLTATVTSAAAGTITGTVTFSLGSKTLGTATVSSGTATLSNVSVSAANGFAAGDNTVMAYYSSGGVNFGPSSGSVVVTALTSKAATSLSLSASTDPVLLNGTETLTATVTSATAGTITGTVTFTLNSTTLGTATISGGTATLSNVAVSAANGFSGGVVTLTATYGGDALYTSSSGSTQITVQSFSISAPSTVTMSAGTNTAVMLNLSSSNYSGPVSFSVASSNPSQVTASAPATTLTSNGGGFSGSSTLTITAAASAASKRPTLPWKSTGALAFAFLLGVPFTFRKRRDARRALTALLVLLAFSLGGLAISCGGKSSAPAGTPYTLTVTPQPNAASPVTITVYVQ